MARRAAALLAVLVLAASCTGATGEAVTTTSLPAVDLEPIATERLLAELELESLVGTTAQLRQLDFVRPVQVVILDDPDYRRRVNELLAPPLEIDADQSGSWLRLLGVLPEGSNTYAATSRLLQHGIALHDPSADQVLVRAGAGIDPYVESVIVHELVHLLHAQNFGVPDPATRTGERGYVYSAIVEGDARRVTQRFIGSFGSDDEFGYELGLQAASEDATAIRATTPAYIINGLRRVTDDGVRYLQGLTNDEIDILLEDVADLEELSISSEELAVAGADLDQQPVALRPVTVLPYQSLPLDTTLGVGPLRLLLEGTVPVDLLGDALVGWGGDELEVRIDGENVIFAYAYRGETTVDADEMAMAFQLLLDTRLVEGAYGSIRVDEESVLVLAASDPSTQRRLDELFADLGEEVFVTPAG